MTKICTSIEQSKKLIEIGIDVTTADLYWSRCTITDFGDSALKVSYAVEPCNISQFRNTKEDVSAWSLSALLKLLPSEFTTVGKNSSTTYRINIRKYKSDDGVDLYQIAYGNYVWHEDCGHTWHDMINTGQKEDFVDAAFDMLVWLKENKFL